MRAVLLSLLPLAKQRPNRHSFSLLSLTISLLAVAGLMLHASPAKAANGLSVDSVSLGGGSTIAIAPGSSIPVSMQVTNDAVYSWSSTGWSIGTSAPGPLTCYNHTDYVGANSSAVENFNITAPTTLGTYNAYFVASSNSSCTGTTTTKTLTNSVIVAAPTLSKTASTSFAIKNDIITFQITATNPLSIPLNNVLVTDTLPTGMTYTTHATTLGTATNSGQTVTWSIPSIPANGSSLLVLAVKLTDSGTLINTASSAGASPVTSSVLVLPNAITHFRLDEPAGSWKGTPGEVVDTGGTGLSGKRQTTTSPTATNAVSPSPTIASQNTSVVGGFCNAGNFDGKGVVVVGTSPSLQYKKTLSATAWIYPTAYPSGSSDLYSILSNDTNYEFHINPQGYLFWWWGSDNLTSDTKIPLNRWTHVAITLDSTDAGGRERIYINGVLDRNTRSWKGELKANTCNFYIGGDVHTQTDCPLIPERNFHGMIDEVKLYNYELSAAEVRADMLSGRNCTGSFDHIQIEHDGDASICSPETVTIKACLDSSCSTLYPGDVKVNLTPDGWTTGNVVTFSGGITTQQLSIGTASTVTLGTISVSPVPASATRCFKGSTESCTMVFNTASCAFDAAETAGSPQSRIYTKLVGTNFSLDVLALNSSTVINTTYKGTVSVDLVDASTTTCPIGTGLTTASSVTFALSDKGRKPVTFNYPNGARNVRVRIKAGSSAPACSADNFAIRPQQLTVTAPTMTNGTLTGTPKAIAGSAFTLNADSGLNSGYDGTPQIDQTLVIDHNGTTIASGALSGTFTAGTGKVAPGTNFKYLDVGNIQFKANAVIDSSFTSVDQPSDCIADSVSNTASGGKFGCNIGSVASAKFGRWYPSHYSFSGNVTPACAGGNFTYMDQDALQIVATVKAHASTGGTPSATDPVTSRYTTGYPITGLAKVTLSGDNGGKAVSIARLTSPTLPTMPDNSLWGTGLYTVNDTYAFSKLANPDGPYDTFVVKAAVDDPDGSTLIGSVSQQQTNATSIRYGRLKIGSASGSELLDLALPLEAQYWTGSYYATNTLDNCTSLNLSSIMFSNFTGNLSACETYLSPAGAQTLVNGRLSLKLKRPGGDGNNAPNRGSVLLTLNTGNTANGSTCVSATSSNATAGNVGWFGANPAGRATFGVTRSPYIYFRESY